MDLVFVLVLPGLLWVQSWYLLGFYGNPRTLGVIAAAVAIALLGIVLFQDKLGMVVGTPPEPAVFFVDVATAVSAFVVMWAVYAVIVAGVYLWGVDSRSLGFYSLFLGIISVLFAAYFFLGGELLNTGVVEPVSWLLGVVAILLAVLSFFLFFYLALQPTGQGEPPSSAFRTMTGYFFLVFSIVVAVLGGLVVLGLDPVL